MTDHGIAFGFCSDLSWTQTASSSPNYCSQLAFLVIMTFCVAAQILSSNIEYLSARLYNSSIVAGWSKDSEWKKGVDGPKLLLKF